MRDDAEQVLQRARRRPLIDTGFIIVAGLACTGAVLTLFLKGTGVFLEVVEKDFGFLLDVLPKVAAGIVIAVLLPLNIDPATINRWLGPDRGWSGLAIAAGFGCLAPGGPGVVMPLAVGLRAAGADAGAIAAFVTGWTLLSLNRTLVWELAFLPLDLVALRVVASLPVPVLVGLLIRRKVPR